MVRRAALVVCALGSAGCFDFDALALDACERTGVCDGGVTRDAGASVDSGVVDAGAPDGGSALDGGVDAGSSDAGAPDAGAPDAGAPDAGAPDAGVMDAGPPDAGPRDAGPPPPTPFRALVATKSFGNQPTGFDPEQVIVGGLIVTSADPIVVGGRIGAGTEGWDSFEWPMSVASPYAEMGDQRIVAAVLGGSGNKFYVSVNGTLNLDGSPGSSQVDARFEVRGQGTFSLVSSAGFVPFPLIPLYVSSAFTASNGASKYAGIGGWVTPPSTLASINITGVAASGFTMLHTDVAGMAGADGFVRLFACADLVTPVFLMATQAVGARQFVLLRTACTRLGLPILGPSGVLQGDGGVKEPLIDVPVSGEQLVLVSTSAVDFMATPDWATALGSGANGAIALSTDQAWVASAGGDAGAVVQRVSFDGGAVLSRFSYAASPADRLSAVALDSAGRAFVVGTARASFSIGDAGYSVQGPSDGVVLRFETSGELHSATLIGGFGEERLDAVGTRAGASARVFVAGSYSDAFVTYDAGIAAPAARDAIWFEFAP